MSSYYSLISLTYSYYQDYHLVITAPGVAPDDLTVAIDRHEGMVRVSGVTTNKNGHRFTCKRVLALPRDADAYSDAVTATHANGVVTVSLPKRVGAGVSEPKQLKVGATDMNPYPYPNPYS